METVGIEAGAFDEDSLGIELVDADLTGGVDDAAVAHADAHMDDAPFGILEEG